jgi:hypothetical protein
MSADPHEQQIPPLRCAPVGMTGCISRDTDSVRMTDYVHNFGYGTVTRLGAAAVVKSAFAPLEFGAEDTEEAVGAVTEEANAEFRAPAVDVVAHLQLDCFLAVDGEIDFVGDADDADVDRGFAWGDDGANG